MANSQPPMRKKQCLLSPMITSSQPSSSSYSNDDLLSAAEKSPFSKSCMSVSTSLASPAFVTYYSLQATKKPQIDDSAFRSIDGSTLADLISNMTDEKFLEKYILIDCRYPFEFSGGHVKHAINVFEPNEVSEIFYPFDQEEFWRINDRVPIFYCEFSQKRGPEMARTLRSQDRKRNVDRYPRLDYPEIYVLNLGYRFFYCEEKFRDLCEPQSYIPMLQPSYSSELNKYTQHKKGRRKRRNLGL